MADAKALDDLRLKMRLLRDMADDGPVDADLLEGVVATVMDLIAENASLEAVIDRLHEQSENLYVSNARRGELIAERILDWRKYETGNGFQAMYAPSEDAAKSTEVGDSLSRFIDEAILKLLKEAARA